MSTTGTLRSIGRKLIDMFFPWTCVNCDTLLKKKSVVCTPCHNMITFLEGDFCMHCSASIPHGEQSCAQCLGKPSYLAALESVFEYDGKSKNLVARLKHYGEKAHIEIFATWMFDRGRALIDREATLVPVPIHRLRLLNRKFNQAALLAKALSTICGVPVELFTLKKYRCTKPQGLLSAALRSQNVQNSFSVSNPAMVAGKSILLVDDVVTTGATLQSCAQTLLLAGAVEVKALTLARSRSNICTLR